MCKVEILDRTDKCPLCHHVIEWDDEKEDLYPDARVIGNKWRLFKNIFLFSSIVIWCILFIIDHDTNPEFLWSFPVGLGIIYANVLLRLTILGKSPYMTKLIWTVLIALVLLIQVDLLTGYRGWAVNFVFPTAVIALDIGILILMLFVNRRNWQSYIIVQIGTLILSAIMMVLIWLDIITYPNYAIIAQMLSLFIFLGTMIIGDRTARIELKRRFHI